MYGSIYTVFLIAATLSALAIPEIQDNYKSNLNKTSIKLGKTLNLEEIRSLVEKKKQKNDTNMYAFSPYFLSLSDTEPVAFMLPCPLLEVV